MHAPRAQNFPGVSNTLSIDDARKLALLSQWPPRARTPAANARDAALASLRQLGYVQIDTISVVARAHHHTLWNRAPRYRESHLEELLARREIFEYWSHAAAYLPMEDFRFSLPRMHAHANGLRHWYAPEPKLMRHALRRIKNEGALRAQDFAGARPRNAGMWEHKPAKQALEQLFMEGKLMVTARRGFQKVYDLAARVLPPHVDTSMPNQKETARHLVTTFLRANGIGTAAEIAYGRRGMRDAVAACAEAMAGDGELAAVKVRAQNYFALPASLELLSRKLPRMQLKILSPFDNLVIQRERVRRLFDFDYQIECYTPAAKRKHGYFSLPVLWRGKLVARIDCKAVRAEKVFLVRNFSGESGYAKNCDACARMASALAAEIFRFAAFHACEHVRIENFRDKTMRTLLRAAVRAAL